MVFDIKPKRQQLGDTNYDTAQMLERMVNRKGIETKYVSMG